MLAIAASLDPGSDDARFMGVGVGDCIGEAGEQSEALEVAAGGEDDRRPPGIRLVGSLVRLFGSLGW